MNLFQSPQEYLFNLCTTSSSEAKRLWRKQILEQWNHQCAYCGDKNNLTIDHIIPQSKGGNNLIYNVVSCCENCNKSKSHKEWENWFNQQEFFTQDRKNAIIEWTQPSKKKQDLYRYKPRQNKVL